MVAGETDLARLLSGMAPVLDQSHYVFVTSEAPSTAELAAAFMVCREDEGTTLVLPVRHSLAPANQPHFARITLTVHSSLEAVGLTAAVAAALQAAGIPANIVAGYYHDHVFVPAADAERARDALQALSGQSSAGV